MKCRFKIVGKRPGDATRFQLAGTLNSPGIEVTSVAKGFEEFYNNRISEHYPTSSSKPTAKQITITFTLP
jgi:hypothetical protein